MYIIHYIFNHMLYKIETSIAFSPLSCVTRKFYSNSSYATMWSGLCQHWSQFPSHLTQFSGAWSSTSIRLVLRHHSLNPWWCIHWKFILRLNYTFAEYLDTCCFSVFIRPIRPIYVTLIIQVLTMLLLRWILQQYPVVQFGGHTQG